MTYLITFHKSTQEFLDHGVKSDIFVQATSFLSIDLSIDKNWLFFILNWSFIQWSLIRWSLIRWSLTWWSLIRWSLIQLFHGAKSPPPFISLRLFSSFLWYSVILQINAGLNKRSHKLWNSLSFLAVFRETGNLTGCLGEGWTFLIFVCFVWWFREKFLILH